MPQEELAGFAGGFAQALKEAVTNRLQAEGLNIRSQGVAANRERNRIYDRNIALQEGELNLKQKAFDQTQKAFETEQERLKLENEIIKEENRKRFNIITSEDQLKRELGDNITPAGLAEQKRLDIATFGTDSVSELQREEFMKKVREGEVPNYLTSKLRVYDASITQSDNKLKDIRRQQNELLKKKPYLSNPESRQGDKDMSVLDSAESALTQAISGFRSERARTQEFAKGLKQIKQLEQEEEKNKIAQGFIDTLKTSIRASRKKLPSIAERRLKKTNSPEFQKDFRDVTNMLRNKDALKLQADQNGITEKELIGLYVEELINAHGIAREEIVSRLKAIFPGIFNAKSSKTNTISSEVAKAIGKGNLE